MTWKDKFTLPRKLHNINEIEEGDLILKKERHDYYICIVSYIDRDRIHGVWEAKSIHHIGKKGIMHLDIDCQADLEFEDDVYLLKKHQKETKFDYELDLTQC